MALTIPNLDKIQKLDPKLGEGLKKVQDYTNQNVTSVAGNKATPPPKALVNPTGGPS